MALLAKPHESNGIIYNLTPGQDLTIGKGVWVQSLDSRAITGYGGGHTVTVQGTLIAQLDAISLDGSAGGNVVVVQQSGRIISETGDAVEMGGLNGKVVNNGLISGEFGVYFTTNGVGTNTVINNGVINAGNAAILSISSQSTLVVNNGSLIANADVAVFGGTGNDVVRNKGFIQGDISLLGGRDTYDGQVGKTLGTVFGGVGNDKFMVGKFHDAFDGGDNFDTLDLRAAKAGVTVNLETPGENTGLAKGDSFAGFERINGSAGGDKLTGLLNDAIQFYGMGGNDTLVGGFGDDTLVGGNGHDDLSGGIGSDTYVYNSLTELGDSVGFYNSLGDDVFTFRGAAFDANLATGTLAGSRFHSGLTNKAGDANDRFIFETDSARLWFDRDGTGTKFAAVLVATLTDTNTVLTASDIVIL